MSRLERAAHAIAYAALILPTVRIRLAALIARWRRPNVAIGQLHVYRGCCSCGSPECTRASDGA